MPKQMIEVDVPEGWELAGIRQPNGAEYFIDMDGKARMFQPSCIFNGRLAIVRPAWQWPAWLKAPWIAMTPYGNWMAYPCEPTICAPSLAGAPNFECWTWGGKEPAYDFDSKLFAFTPPACEDWRTSKRRNPNLGKEGG